MIRSETAVEDRLSVDAVVLLHVHPKKSDGTRIRAVIRGWRTNEYILLEVPSDQRSSEALAPGAPCVIRFLSEGVACAFDSVILNGNRQHNVISFQLEWPAAMVSVPVRRNERIDVRLLCRVHGLGSHAVTGEVRDLSVGGCRFVANEEIPVGGGLTLTFRLPSGVILRTVPVQIRHVRPVRGGYTCGCQFTDDAVEARKEIGYYIATTLQRFRQENSALRRLLILTNDKEPLEDLENALLRQGYEFSTCDSLVDCFFLMRLMAPRALLINTKAAGNFLLAACGMMRQAPGFEDLPLFVYGASDRPHIAREVQAAGATGYFGHPRMIADLPSMLVEDEEALLAPLEAAEQEMEPVVRTSKPHKDDATEAIQNFLRM